MSADEQRPPISAATVVAHAEGVIDGEMDGEVVLMSVANGEYYAMDGVGSRVWKLVATPRSVESVCLALRREFHAGPGELEGDVTAFVTDLVGRRLLRVES